MASVQVRQKHVSQRQTFLYLEQIIHRHDSAARATAIKQMDQGLDFYFSKRSYAVKFIKFLGDVAPITSQSCKKVLSCDPTSSIHNYKYIFSVEICPICREDLICLPPRAVVSLGCIGPLVICTNVSSAITILDPFSLRHSFFDTAQYLSLSLKSLLSSKHLVKYLVFDVEVLPSEVDFAGSKYILANVVVARVSDLGNFLFTRTHLGHLLKPGDYVLGYDLVEDNSADDANSGNSKGLVLPEVIIVKKSYEEKRKIIHENPRSWKLKSLDIEYQDFDVKVEQGKMDLEYEQFLQDLEENPELRSNISLYHNEEYQPFEMALITDKDDAPFVQVNELLDDLDIAEVVNEDIDTY